MQLLPEEQRMGKKTEQQSRGTYQLESRAQAMLAERNAATK